MNQQAIPGIEKQNSKEDFSKHFLNTENLAKLAELCAYGEVQNLRCRWTAWKAFLGLIPIGDEAKIRAEVKKQRSFYSGEYDKFMNFRSKVKLSADVDNPLSTNTNNPWNSHFTDSELKDEIRKDIERTYQDMDFFLVKSTQTVLTNILFIWSKQNQEVSYRQGMNEIVAVLTYACFTESFAAANPDENLYDFLNDEKYSEADIYTVFKRIMELDQKQMFAVSQPSKKKKKQTSDGPQRPDLPIVHRAVYVQEDLLPKLNAQLFSHFQTLGVEPHIYMMRWLRCMLVREFKITQALELWDAVYAYHYKFTPTSKKLEMFDYLCVAMILNISKDLFDIDNGGMILGKLLKYPPTEDVTRLVQNCHHGVLDVLSSEGAKSNKPVQSQNPFGARSDEPRVGGFGAPEKKVVLFNPGMPIFKDKPNREATTSRQNDTSPMLQPTIKASTQSSLPFKHANSTGTTTNSTSVTSPESRKEDDNQYKGKTSSDKNEGFAVNENKQERSSRIVLFGQPTTNKPEPKENPVLFNGGAPKTTTTVARDVKIGETLPTDPERETSECIKKLQNVLKLVKIENDDNHSLNLEEAVTDLNSVIKILRDRILKK